MKQNHLLLMMLALGLAFEPRLPARTFVVTDTADSTNISSLRGAVIEANRRGGNNTILLSQPVYALTLAGANEDASLTGDLDVTRGRLTIMSKKALVQIDASGLGDRVFHVLPGASLKLSRLIITGGFTPTGTDGFLADGQNGVDGGGIFNAGDLSVMNCAIEGNLTGSGGRGYPGFAPGAGGNGAGIYSRGTLLVKDSVVSGNFCGTGAGGSQGVAAGHGGDGAGIYNTGRMQILTSTIADNLCGAGGIGHTNQGAGGTGGNGGGIFSSNTVILMRCAVIGNSGGAGGRAGVGPGSADGGAGGSGGGIYNIGVITLNTCTISGNEGGGGGMGGDRGAGGVGGDGGGLFSTHIFALLSCTISDNASGTGGTGGDAYFSGNGDTGGTGGNGGNGAGVFNAGGELSSSVRNSLIALNLLGVPGVGGAGSNPSNNVSGFFPDSGTNGNPGVIGSGPDLSGTFASSGFNLIGDADGSTGFTDGVFADQVGDGSSPIDPLLGPLQDNGGPTLTQALLPGSPAMDKGHSTNLSVDQRGHRRPQNDSSIAKAPGGNEADIGAFEVDVP